MAPLSEWLCVLPGDAFSSSQKLVIYHYSRRPWEWFGQTAPAYRLGAQRKQHTAGQNKGDDDHYFPRYVQKTTTKKKLIVLCSSLNSGDRLGRQYGMFDHLDFVIFLHKKDAIPFSPCSHTLLWWFRAHSHQECLEWFKQTLDHSLFLVKMRTTAIKIGSATHNHTRAAWKCKSVSYSKQNVVQFVWSKNSHTN